MGMTREDLKKFIEETTAPLLKEFAGKDVADAVRANVDALVKEARAANGGNVVAGIFGDDKSLKKYDKGDSFARYARAVAAAKIDGGGRSKALEILKGWGDETLAKTVEETRSKALAAGDPTAGGFLVPTQFSTEIIELLRPSAVVRSLNPVVMPMPMGTLKVPKITSGATAAYVGENANIAKTQQAFGQISLSFKKLAAVVPISNDLVRYSSPQADAVVRDDIVRAIAQREDLAFLTGDGTAGTPRGIKNWINPTNKFNANGTVSLANTTTDLGKLIQALLAANIQLIPQQNAGSTNNQPTDARPGWIFSPKTYRYLTSLQTSTGLYAFRDEMVSRGTLWGYPYRVTSQILETYSSAGVAGQGALSEVYFGAFAHAVIGESLSMMVDASQEAAYYDGANVQAAFSEDQTVIRVIEEHDFCLRHDLAFAQLAQVGWGN